jgi:two-component system, sensor histidine kinase RpfC
MKTPTGVDAKRNNLLKNEIGQAKVRLGICLFMAVYFWATGYTNHPLYISFIIYCLLFFIIVHTAKQFSSYRSFLCLLLDNYFTISGLHVTGEQGTFLFILLIQIAIGYGLRFGRIHLWASVSAACIGITTLYFFSPTWRGNLHLALAYIIGTPFIAFYIDYLVKHLKKSKLESDKRADDIADLLAFVAHDIRTPLHSLLATAAAAKSTAEDELQRTRIVRIEDGIRSLARLATDVLGVTAGDTENRRDSRHTIPVCRWVIEMVRRFQDEMESQRTELTYNLDMDVWSAVRLDLLSAERLVLNTLSNAVRHAVNGEIEVDLSYIRHDESKGDLHLRISNRPGDPNGIVGPSTVNEPVVNSERYYGTGLGLLVAKELAHSLGGDFSFAKNGQNEYVAQIRIPCSRASDDEIPDVFLPVLLITQNIDLILRVRQVLQDETNVMVLDRISKLSAYNGNLDKDVAAVLIDERALRPPKTETSAMPTTILPRYFSLISETDDHPLSKSKAFGSNLLRREPSEREILNSIMCQIALRENEGLTDLNIENYFGGVLKGKRILILDDNRINRALLQEGLRNADGEFIFATNILDGIEILQTEIVDVIILDWNLGDQSGIRILEHLSSIPNEKQPAVFILSSDRAATIEKSLGRASVAAVMERPIAIREIIRVIDQYINGRSLDIQLFASCNGSKLFSVATYEELICSGTQRESIVNLLSNFESEVENQLHQIREAIRERNLARLRGQFHSIKSLCFAAGANIMGDYFDCLGGQISNCSDIERIFDVSRFVDNGIRVWNFTKAHVGIYKLTLAEV